VDQTYNYKNLNTPDWPAVQWLDVTNEHFQVWMRVSSMGNFRKIWGRIQQPLPNGTYNLTI